MLKNVQIKWDHPEEQQWLADDNITFCLQKECKNTHFVTKELDLTQLCIEAAIEMQHANITKHEQFVNWQDADTGADNERLRCGWYPEKLMKVTIEWVDESEADPKNFESGITRRAVDGASCSCPVNSADTTLICQQCGLPVSPRN